MRELPALSDREIARELGVGNKTVSRWRQEANLERRPNEDGLTSDDLCALLSEQGLQMGVGRLRAWRVAGLLVPSRRHWSGQRSTFIWPRRSVEQGLEAERLLRRYRSSRAAVVGLFALGFDVNERRLRAAFARHLDARSTQLEALLELLGHTEPEWDEAAQLVLRDFGHGRGHRSTRRMGRVLQQHLPPDERLPLTEYVESTMRAAAMVLVHGQAGTDDEIAELLARTPSISPPLAPAPPVSKQVEMAKWLESRMQVDVLANVLAASSVDELASTRDDAWAAAGCFDALLRPGLQATSLRERFPDGPLAHGIRTDPFLFGFVVLVLHSIRQHPQLKTTADAFANVCREALPDMDRAADEISLSLYGTPS